jgi:ABC-type nitrate/sulfonate/bicarbonate transport system substrate-binding protein
MEREGEITMYRKPLSWITVALCLVIIISMVGCGSKSEKVTVVLDWTPNTNHTGLYVALDNGYFQDLGLDVEIIQPTTGLAEPLVASGQAQFGVSSQEVLTFARLEGIPVVSIAAIIQHNTSGFASLKDQGILTPKEFEGKRYGGWGSPVESATIKALMDKVNGDFNKVTIVTTGSVDFFASTEKNADFSWIFFGWDGIAAELRDVELNFISVPDYDPVLDYYTPVLMTSESMIKDKPEIVEKFMKAVTKGYLYAMDQPEDSAMILLKYAPELDQELVLASQIWLKDKYQADAAVWGDQKLSVWQNYMDWLFANALVESVMDVENAFTTDFLAN